MQQQQRRRGRPKLTSGISSWGAGPLFGKKAMTYGSCNVNSPLKRVPRLSFTCTYMHAGTCVHTPTFVALRAKALGF